MISTWKQELMKRASELFERANKAPAVDDTQKVIDDLHRKIGQLQVERDFLAGQPAISRLVRGGRGWPKVPAAGISRWNGQTRG
jgi:transposase